MSISADLGWNITSVLAWFFASYLYLGVGITLGYHRLLTHKSLKVPRWLAYVIVAGGYLCLMGSPIVWVAVHRLHHLKSDQPGDPHTPTEGFWHALVGWMFHMDKVQSEEEVQQIASDLMQDPVYRALGYTHKPDQAWLCLGINIAVRALIGIFFGIPALLANLAATFIVFFSTQFVNTFCHMPKYGYQTYNTREKSTNVWWVGILACGEGWHNNHHAVPKSARHGIAWWEFDVTWITIWLLEKIGLAKSVIRPPVFVLAAKSQKASGQLEVLPGAGELAAKTKAIEPAKAEKKEEKVPVSTQ